MRSRIGKLCSHVILGLIVVTGFTLAAGSTPKGQNLNPKRGEVQTNFAGVEFVYIPAGPFTMGSLAYATERPVRLIDLDAYWIGKNDVTVGQFRDFCKATGYSYAWDKYQPAWGWNDNHPMVNVTWGEARAYCKWVGGDLPTEAQWEKAARGWDSREYPWGLSFLPGYSAFGTWSGTKPAGSYPNGASPYGCLDMAGNACQWCLDWYGDYDSSQTKNPSGPTTGTLRTLRGGDWGSTNISAVRSTTRYRYSPNDRLYDAFGFRCVINSRSFATHGGALDKSLVESMPPPVHYNEDQILQFNAPVHKLEGDLRGHFVPWGRPGKQVGDETINPKDQMEFVWIPAARFEMGTKDSGLMGRANPPRNVSLSGYWIGKYPVTWFQYNHFCITEGRTPMYAIPNIPPQAHLPILYVTWKQAKTYAEWAGVQLPTEAQWEHAARGPKNLLYPWGNQWDPKKCANGLGQPEVVGTHTAARSAFGCYDMAGNVWQWCSDWFAPYGNLTNVDPTGPETGRVHVLRGGSWRMFGEPFYRSSYRLPSSGTDDTIGFRCVVTFK